MSFVEALEVGYSKHKNPYHNLIHAADVTQTVHYLLLKTGMVVSRLEYIPISLKKEETCLAQSQKASPYPQSILISHSVFFPP